MSTVTEFLGRLRKAELQTIHQFWLPGEPVQTSRQELQVRVTDALCRGSGVEERIKRLNRVQKELIITLLQSPQHMLETRSAVQHLETRGISRTEVESSSRMLVERGFVERVRPEAVGPTPEAERLSVPDELAEHLERELEVERIPVSPADQLSQKRLPFEIEFDETRLESRVEGLADPELAALVRIAIRHRGLIEPGTPGVRSIIGETSFDRPEWRRALEDAGIGTIGSLSLQDFGIVTPTPSLVIFQEWIQRRARRDLQVEEVPDLEIEAGVDLYIDIERVASRIETAPARLTRGKRVPKRLADSMRGELQLPRLSDHLDGDAVQRALLMGLRLGILENFADHLRVHDDRLRSWRKLSLLRQAEILMGKFLDESQGDRWSFHQESLRQLLIDQLIEEAPAGWVSLDALVSLVVSTYVLELEEREVRTALRQRREEDFSREKLQSTFQRLGTDLLYWIVNRFLLLGMCELGLIDGRLAAFRLTSLAKELLGIAREPRECRILVNPDFEIMLFTEGLRGMRLELELARFGNRTSAERVRRYRVDRESMRRGILTGLAVDDVLGILEEASSHPLPDPVRHAVQDWGRDLDWVTASAALVLTGLRADRSAELQQVLEEEDIPFLLCSDDSIVLTGSQTISRDGAPPEVLEILREHGLLVREDRGSGLELRAERGR
ncbi:MAG: helicase-associated domain-containing protein [Planctomycetota bacterium]